MLHRLSAKAIDGLAKPGYFCDGGGLYLQVAKGLTKSWIFRYGFGGRSRDMGLGSSLTVSLNEARKKAERCRKQIEEGIDPIDARRLKRRTLQAGSLEKLKAELREEILSELGINASGSGE